VASTGTTSPLSHSSKITIVYVCTTKVMFYWTILEQIQYGFRHLLRPLAYSSFYCIFYSTSYHASIPPSFVFFAGCCGEV